MKLYLVWFGAVATCLGVAFVAHKYLGTEAAVVVDGALMALLGLMKSPLSLPKASE